MKLSDSEPAIRAALERLAESPPELRCFVIIECLLMKRFVQFCTPPPPSKFEDSPRLVAPLGEPLIFDGTGDGKPGGYEYVQEFCDVEPGVRLALETLRKYLPDEAELRIVEESTHVKRPS